MTAESSLRYISRDTQQKCLHHVRLGGGSSMLAMTELNLATYSNLHVPVGVQSFWVTIRTFNYVKILSVCLLLFGDLYSAAYMFVLFIVSIIFSCVHQGMGWGEGIVGKQNRHNNVSRF